MPTSLILNPVTANTGGKWDLAEVAKDGRRGGCPHHLRACDHTGPSGGGGSEELTCGWTHEDEEAAGGWQVGQVERDHKQGKAGGPQKFETARGQILS